MAVWEKAPRISLLTLCASIAVYYYLGISLDSSKIKFLLLPEFQISEPGKVENVAAFAVVFLLWQYILTSVTEFRVIRANALAWAFSIPWFSALSLWFVGKYERSYVTFVSDEGETCMHMFLDDDSATHTLAFENKATMNPFWITSLKVSGYEHAAMPNMISRFTESNTRKWYGLGYEESLGDDHMAMRLWLKDCMPWGITLMFAQIVSCCLYTFFDARAFSYGVPILSAIAVLTVWLS